MRSSITLSLLFVAVACSGNSLKVGSDGSDDGGTSNGGSSPGARGGSTPTGGAGGTSSGGSTAARGGSLVDPQGGEAGTAGVAGTGGAIPAGGTGAGGTSALGGSAGSGPPITSCTEQFPFAGEWHGNVLDYFFEPIDELTLSVRAQGGAGGYVGEVTWGSGDPPPPATDPDAPYPPGLDVGGSAGTGGGGGNVDPWPGFPYQVVRGAGCDASFRVNVSVYATWESWCSLQVPIDSGDHGWGCTYRGGGSSDGVTCQVQDNQGRPLAEYPMWKCNLCGWVGSGVCVCDEFGCVANREPTHSFDLTLSQTGGVDVLSGPDSRCSECTVRLERVQ